MTKSESFEPTDIVKSRYPNPESLVAYVKTLPYGYTDGQITVKNMGEIGLGLRLPRKLKSEELDGAIEYLRQAERQRLRDGGE